MKNNTIKKIILALTRIGMGWLFFYAGITKVLNSNWSAAGYLEHAQTFSGFYSWLASPDILPFINFLNQWGLTIIGAMLILGVFVRLSSILGIILMILYYFPILHFPLAGDHAMIIDDHIIYIFVFLILYHFDTGKYYSVRRLLKR